MAFRAKRVGKGIYKAVERKASTDMGMKEFLRRRQGQKPQIGIPRGEMPMRRPRPDMPSIMPIKPPRDRKIGGPVKPNQPERWSGPVLPPKPIYKPDIPGKRPTPPERPIERPIRPGGPKPILDEDQKKKYMGDMKREMMLRKSGVNRVNRKKARIQPVPIKKRLASSRASLFRRKY